MSDLSPSNSRPVECPELEAAMWRLYRDFLDQAERKRRWSVRNSIPWDRCNQNLAPEIAAVVEAFCAIELYLPDYLGKILPVVRHSRARVWFYANWGYEESKHSLALNDWLVRSGQRTEEQMADLDDKVFKHEWNLPFDSHLGMLAYAMVQERATWLNYRNLRQRAIDKGGDPALEKVLMLVMVDERAHHSFFQECVELFLKFDRAAMIEQLRRVMHSFQMPTIHSTAEGLQQIARIKSLAIFDEDIYYREVYLPLLADLGVSRAEMRNKARVPKSAQV